MRAEKKRITGIVIHKQIAPGSKSDHVGVVLRADDGREYVLRRIGGNAFRDDELEKIIGETITGTGLVTGRTFLMNDWNIKESD
jgi:hypothetical protein